MTIVFILLGIILIFLTNFMLLTLSTLSIEIKDFEADNYEKQEENLKKYIVFVRIYLFNKIKWIGFKIDKKRILKFKKGYLLKIINKKLGVERGEELKKIEKITLKNIKKVFNRRTLKIIKDADVEISKLNLDFDIGLENVIITAFAVSAISSAISIIIGRNVKEYGSKKIYYQITPVYINKNVFKIKLNCIINVKMVHIMNIIYVLLKRRRRNIYGGTSNRRTYDYSHEQHRRHGGRKYNYRGAN